MTLPSQSAGHTKGPWYVDGEGIKTMVRGADATIVALRHRLPGVVNEENMSLIARAPDLLAENSKLKGQLEEAVGALERIVRLNDSLPEEHPARLSHGEYKQACAVLERAKLKEAGS